MTRGSRSSGWMPASSHEALRVAGTGLLILGAVMASPADEAALVAVTGGLAAPVAPAAAAGTFVGGVLTMGLGGVLLFASRGGRGGR